MAKVPNRTRRVFFLGAGFSRSLGLPNTQELLDDVASHVADKELRKAYRHFYPVERVTGFRPNVVDFFSLLQAHAAIARQLDGAALPGDPFLEAPKLLRDLRWAIVRRLLLATRALDFSDPLPGIERMFDGNSVLITSNWDPVLEMYATIRQHRSGYHFNQTDTATTILKLHGSVDWAERTALRVGLTAQDFASLRERLGPGGNQLTIQDDEPIVRVRSIENATRSWQFAKARVEDPLIITMAPGKASDLEPLRRIWNDAYRAISAAKEIEFVGYSLPPEDTEIRALVLAGIRRGTKNPRITVHNPAPDVHDRFRAAIDRRVVDDYTAFDPWE